MLTRLYEDNHVHTSYSDGEPTLKQYLEFNKKYKRFSRITFTDHVNTKTAWFPEYVAQIEKLRLEHPEVVIKIGCEVKVMNDGSLNTTPEILEACDTVIGSVHFFEDVNNFDSMAELSREDIIRKERKLLALLVKHPEVDIVGHPYGMSVLFRKANIPYDLYEEVYNWCVQNNKRFEYNPSYSCPNLEVFIRDVIARDGTDYISLGSDAHELNRFGDANKSLVPQINVLVTESGSSVAQGLLKILIRDKDMMRYVIHTADCNANATGNHFVGIDKKVVLPRITDPKYLPKLRQYIVTNDIDIILIGGDIELEILSNPKNQMYLLKNTECRIIVGASGLIDLALNKDNTLAWCLENQIPYPKVLAKAKYAEPGKTYIVKPKAGWGMEGFFKTNDFNQLLTVDFEKNLVQEFIDGQEITCEVVKTKGRVNGIICMWRVIQKGVTKTAKTLDPKLPENIKYYDFVKEVAEALPFTGDFNIQLLDDGNIYLLEINSRFSGTTGLRNLCGFDSLRMMILYERFGISINEEYLKNFQCLNFYRYWDEVVE